MMATVSAPTDRPRRRHPWRRRAALAIVVLLLLGIAGYTYASLVIYDDLSLTVAHCAGRFADNNPSSFTATGVDTAPFVMPDYQSVTFASRDPGIDMSAWYIPTDKAPAAPAVVLVHGHDSCKREDRMLLAAGMLHRDGIAVLLVDLRNHGDSTVVNGRFAGGTREYRDALAGFDWLVDERGFDAHHVGLFGMSLGAATALIATGEEPRVAAVWSDSSYADLDVAVQAELARNGYPSFFRYGGYLMAEMRSGDDLLSLSPIDAVAKLNGRPIFITHGSADTRLSPTYAFDLASAVRADGGSVEPWIVPGAEHTQAVVLQPAEYQRRLDAFFNTAIGY
jgi:dipeptidyl aminopeptidase/acylaminoacyl peptidase